MQTVFNLLVVAEGVKRQLFQGAVWRTLLLLWTIVNEDLLKEERRPKGAARIGETNV